MIRTRTSNNQNNRSLAGVAVGITTAVLLAGCSSMDEPLPAPQPSSPTHSATSQIPSNAEADDARLDQRAVGAAATQAAAFGFNNQAIATPADITGLREDSQLRAINQTGTRVEPAECLGPLNAMDWTPLLVNTEEVARVDFGSDTFNGTGTVEVAGMTAHTGADETARAELSRYFDTIDDLITNCSELTMTLTDTSVPEGYGAVTTYEFSIEPVPVEQGSGVLWQRTPITTGSGSGGQSLTSRVLVRHVGEYAVLVSFSGSSDVADEEFQDMSTALMGAVETELNAP